MNLVSASAPTTLPLARSRIGWNAVTSNLPARTASTRDRTPDAERTGKVPVNRPGFPVRGLAS